MPHRQKTSARYSGDACQAARSAYAAAPDRTSAALRRPDDVFGMHRSAWYIRNGLHETTRPTQRVAPRVPPQAPPRRILGEFRHGPARGTIRLCPTPRTKPSGRTPPPSCSQSRATPSCARTAHATNSARTRSCFVVMNWRRGCNRSSWCRRRPALRAPLDGAVAFNSGRFSRLVFDLVRGTGPSRLKNPSTPSPRVKAVRPATMPQ